jgi:hypothetical protein
MSANHYGLDPYNDAIVLLQELHKQTQFFHETFWKLPGFQTRAMSLLNSGGVDE